MTAPTLTAGTSHAGRARRRQAVMRRTVLSVGTVAMLVPVVALLEYSVRFPLTGAVDLSAWRKIVAGRTTEYQSLAPLWSGLTSSLVMCALTVAIMLGLLLPTMVWVRLRAPRAARTLELVCLLPLSIPAVVLVVGLAPVYRFLAGTPLGSSTVWLSFAYVILVLPFAFRALDAGLRAIDLVTLAEAARTLGGGWSRILLRVVVPNLRPAIVSSSFVTVAVVLGEFTVARLLARENLQTALFQVNLSDSQVAAAMAFVLLAGTTALLVTLELLATRTARTARPRGTEPSRPGVGREPRGDRR